MQNHHNEVNYLNKQNTGAKFNLNEIYETLIVYYC